MTGLRTDLDILLKEALNKAGLCIAGKRFPQGLALSQTIICVNDRLLIAGCYWREIFKTGLTHA